MDETFIDQDCNQRSERQIFRVSQIGQRGDQNP
jgi:hypothetical protein